MQRGWVFKGHEIVTDPTRRLNKTPLTEHFLEISIGSLFLLAAQGCADVGCVVTVVLIARFMFPKKRLMSGKNRIQGGCLKK